MDVLTTGRLPPTVAVSIKYLQTAPPAQINQLIEEKTKVVIILRPPPGKKKPFGLTTIYLPITEEEKAEIKRIDANARDI